jgi:hypothetical protein
VPWRISTTAPALRVVDGRKVEQRREATLAHAREEDPEGRSKERIMGTGRIAHAACRAHHHANDTRTRASLVWSDNTARNWLTDGQILDVRCSLEQHIMDLDVPCGQRLARRGIQYFPL